MSATDEQGARAKEKYRPLDISKNEVRLLSFENTAPNTPIRLSLHYVSLKDWKPEYVAFRDENTSKHSSQLSEAWSEGIKFTPDTPKPEMSDAISRFIWGDYVCLSYAWGDCKEEKATVFLDDVETAVTKNLEGALQDLRSSFECQLGMKIWVDALCINQFDIDDRNKHVLRVKDIFGGSFSVTASIKDRGSRDDGLQPWTHRLLQCEVILRKCGRQGLEDVLGTADCDIKASNAIWQQIEGPLEEIEGMVFDEYEHPQPNQDRWLYDDILSKRSVCAELWVVFRMKYWSRLWVVQELVVSPTTSKLRWDKTPIHLSTIQTLADIMLTNSRFEWFMFEQGVSELKPGLEFMAFITKWRTLQTTTNYPERLDDDIVRELNLLGQRANCSLPQDKVFGLLGLFPSPVSSVLVIDYSRETEEVLSDFCSLVLEWKCT
ncbi:heterokaryon incompatibility protein-domain-containing protein [Penicillium frequentans]|nr:heterokaryon incompatibility protein-domain-containing protein [Penicillium glabrum]